MEPIIFLAKDVNNHDLTAAGNRNHADSYGQDSIWFLNNVYYIFEDEEADADTQMQYDNVILVDSDVEGNVSRVELVSEKYQLLSFERPEESHDTFMLNVMSKLDEKSNTTDLNQLIELYHKRNRQLRKLIDSIGSD